MHKNSLAFTLAATMIWLCSLSSPAQNAAYNQLRKGWANPPTEAMPRTWWHWLNGNVSKSGITKDLEAMQRVGIHEAQIFNVDLKYPNGGVRYLSNEWLDCFEHACAEAARLGLELSFHNTAGWSASGGPWITPDLAMQTLTMSDTIVQGGKLQKVHLSQPRTRAGYYKDIAILAFPRPKVKGHIDNLGKKALSEQLFEAHLQPSSEKGDARAVVSKHKIINLTSQFHANGILSAQLPRGEWVVLRIGHTPTGARNRPATAEATGLECDKMNTAALDVHWNNGIQPILNRVKPYVGKTLKGCVIDSYEVGCGNWTADFAQQFESLRGYNPLYWLPVVAGYVVESNTLSERFLWDMRRTVSDLMSQNYYAHFAKLCHQAGLTLYAEPYTGPFESAQVGRNADVVMGEFWSTRTFMHSPRLAASIAHLQGKKIVGAEAFTDGYGRWLAHPGYLRPSGDHAWTEGVNRLVFHAYTHQPWDIMPGITMSRYGIDFNRNTTWWEKSKPYMQYISRSQFLLQQGRQVCDILVFSGETSPNDGMMRPEIKALGHDYDLCGTDALQELRVDDGWIVAPSGSRYRLLMLLPNDKWLTPIALKKLNQLANAGATIVGVKPQESPSLQNYPQCDNEVKSLAAKLWDSNKILSPRSLADVLDSLQLYPDFSGGTSGVDLRYIHRAVDDVDIYLIVNPKKEQRKEVVRLRSKGKRPQLWNAVTGQITDIKDWRQEGELAAVQLMLEAQQSLFVVMTPDNNSHRPAFHFDNSLASSTFREGMMDVTALVASKVKHGQLSIGVNNKVMPADPAPGSVKELRVEYISGGKVKVVKGGEPSTLTIRTKDDLKILRAYYGKFPFDMETLPVEPLVVPLDDDWMLSLPSGKTFDITKLASWSESDDSSLRYFAGTATYKRNIKVGNDLLKGKHSWLDLGHVAVIAEVSVNGHIVDTLWCAPYKVDVLPFMREGNNTIEIRVTNLPINKMIGDERYADDIERKALLVSKWPDWLIGESQRTSGRSTIATWRHYTAESPLVDAGLIGPVRLVAE